MKNVVIIFTNDGGKYYIEGVFESIEKAKEEWGFDKVIDCTEGHRAWELLQSELHEPTIPDNGQLAVIEKVE